MVLRNNSVHAFLSLPLVEDYDRHKIASERTITIACPPLLSITCSIITRRITAQRQSISERTGLLHTHQLTQVSYVACPV